MTYYEIDAAVERLARDGRFFHFLGDCAPETPVVLGDARLSLAAAPDGAYDLLILDAFSSDAIPLHLLTREALSLYLAKLAEDGILLLHISNRYLRLAPVVAALAADAGIVARRRDDPSTEAEAATLEHSRSDWVALARRPDSLAFLDDFADWERLAAAPDDPLWTDDYSNLVGVLRWSPRD